MNLRRPMLRPMCVSNVRPMCAQCASNVRPMLAHVKNVHFQSGTPLHHVDGDLILPIRLIDHLFQFCAHTVYVRLSEYVWTPRSALGLASELASGSPRTSCDPEQRRCLCATYLARSASGARWTSLPCSCAECCWQMAWSTSWVAGTGSDCTSSL